MRKLTLLISMLFLSLGMAWAEVPFKVSNAPTNGVWDANTTWYFISFPNSDSYHSGGYLAAEGDGFMSATNFESKVSKGKLLITQTEKPIKKSALWCIVGDEKNGYRFFNMMNPNLLLGMPTNGEEARMYNNWEKKDVCYNFAYAPSTSDKWENECVTFKIPGGNKYWNNQDVGGNGADYLRTWDNSAAHSDNGSAVLLTKVTDDELNQMLATLPQEGKYYAIKNLRSGKYAAYTGDATQLAQETRDKSSNAQIWYFTPDGNGYKLHNQATDKLFAGTSSFTDSGTKVYVKENPYCAGYVCVSTNENLSGNCWDDASGSTNIGTWNPRVDDFHGTSWILEEVPAAQSGNSVYYSLTDAIAKAQEGETVVLLRDVTIAEKLVINKSVTLDGNDKTLTYTGSDRAITVESTANGADLTVENLTVNCTASYCQRGINYNTNGNLTLEKVTVMGTNVTYAVSLPGSSDNCVVTINNSNISGNIALNVWGENSTINAENTTFTAVDNNTVEGYAAVKLNNDGTTSAEGTVITIKGGKIDVTGSACTDTEATSNGTSTGKINISETTDVNGEVAEMVAVIRYADGNSYSFMTIEDAIAKAQAGETVTLLRDITASDIITINKAITLNGNGHKLNTTASRAINVDTQNGTVTTTIKNLEIVGGKGCQRGINIIDGAYKDTPANVTLEGVKISGVSTYGVQLASSVGSENTITIKDSEIHSWIALNINGDNQTVTVENSKLYGTAYSANDKGNTITVTGKNTTVTMTGGVLSAATSEGLADHHCGHIVEPTSYINLTNVETIVAKEGDEVIRRAMARIEGKEGSFMTIEDAIAKAQEGETVVLLRDVTIAEKLVINKSVTLDGNDKTLTYTGSDRAITVESTANGADLTVENLTVNCTASYCQRGINYNTNGNLTLEKVTVKGTNVTYAVNLPGSSDGAQVTITDSNISGNIALNVWGENSTINATNTTFTAVDNNTVEGYAAVKLNNDGTTSAEGTVINITGGKIDVTGSACTDTEATSNGTSTGKINISDSTVVNGKNAEMVAVIRYADGNSYSFMTIEDAIAKAKAGETVTLLRNVTINELVKIDKAITLDLNGKKVTSTAKKAFEVHADATIKNGAIEAAQRCVDTRTAVELTLTDVTLIADEYTTHGNPQPLTIGGSENGTKVDMTNVNISAAAGYCIITFVKTELTATNSTIGGYNALYVKPGSDKSVFNFVDSDLSGTTGNNDVVGNSFSTIAVRANDVAVNVDGASTVTATGNYSYAISFKSSYQNEAATGSSVTVAGVITGNILNAPNGNTVKVKADYADELAVAGYATIEAENGLVTVIKAVAQIGETSYYATLQAAIDAAQADETVDVLENIELSTPVVVAADKKLTLNLNGKTITGTPAEAKAYAVITNYGTLTIEGNGSVICNHTLAGSTGYAVNTITNCGTLTIDGATIENKSTASNQIGYAIDNNSTSADATVTVVSGKVIASGSNYYDGIRLFCNSTVAENDVYVEGGEVSTIWMQNPSDGATKNTKDVNGYVGISGGTVGVLSLEPSAEFQAAITAGRVGEVSYFQTADGRNLVGFITGGTFGMDVTAFCAAHHFCTDSNGDGIWIVEKDPAYEDNLTLVDGEFTDYADYAGKTVGTFTYLRASIPTTWTAFYVPFEVPVSQLAEHFEVAYINGVRRDDTDYDGELDKFVMEIIYIHGGDNCDGSGKTLKAHYPYFIRSKGDDRKDLTITLTDVTLSPATPQSYTCSTFTELFTVIGTTKVEHPISDSSALRYTVSSGNWSKKTEENDLNPFRFYMELTSRDGSSPVVSDSEASMAIAVRGEELPDGTTLIYDVEAEAAEDMIFDLQGRRVLETEKGGIYIKGGKKFIAQ